MPAYAQLPNNLVGDPWRELFGYIWSSTTGWIKLNSCDDYADLDEIHSIDFTRKVGCTTRGPGYAVRVDGNTGIMFGEAWSPNVGWISFNPNNGCGPSARITADTVVGSDGIVRGQTAGKMIGTARVLSVTDSSRGWDHPTKNGGWNGCIYLDSASMKPDDQCSAEFKVTLNQPEQFLLSDQRGTSYRRFVFTGYAWSGGGSDDRYRASSSCARTHDTLGGGLSWIEFGMNRNRYAYNPMETLFQPKIYIRSQNTQIISFVAENKTDSGVSDWNPECTLGNTNRITWSWNVVNAYKCSISVPGYDTVTVLDRSSFSGFGAVIDHKGSYTFTNISHNTSGLPFTLECTNGPSIAKKTVVGAKCLPLPECSDGINNDPFSVANPQGDNDIDRMDKNCYSACKITDATLYIADASETSSCPVIPVGPIVAPKRAIPFFREE